MRRTFIVDVEGATLTEAIRASRRNAVCAWPPFESVLRAGGSIQDVYVEQDGREIGVVIVTRDACAF